MKVSSRGICISNRIDCCIETNHTQKAVLGIPASDDFHGGKIVGIRTADGDLVGVGQGNSVDVRPHVSKPTGAELDAGSAVELRMSCLHDALSGNYKLACKSTRDELIVQASKTLHGEGAIYREGWHVRSGTSSNEHDRCVPQAQRTLKQNKTSNPLQPWQSEAQDKKYTPGQRGEST